MHEGIPVFPSEIAHVLPIDKNDRQLSVVVLVGYYFGFLSVR